LLTPTRFSTRLEESAIRSLLEKEKVRSFLLYSVLFCSILFCPFSFLFFLLSFLLSQAGSKSHCRIGRRSEGNASGRKAKDFHPPRPCVRRKRMVSFCFFADDFIRYGAEGWKKKKNPVFCLFEPFLFKKIQRCPS
jgi:hypothetical protein